jgi:hypothetical protein
VIHRPLASRDGPALPSQNLNAAAIFYLLRLSSYSGRSTALTSIRMTAISTQARVPSEEITGLVERVTFCKPESGFAVPGKGHLWHWLRHVGSDCPWRRNSEGPANRVGAVIDHAFTGSPDCRSAGFKDVHVQYRLFQESEAA